MDKPHSASAARARLMLSNPTIRALRDGCPDPPSNLTLALNTVLVDEWRRVMPGRRPIPTETKVPAVLRTASPPKLHTLSAYYLNTIPIRKWNEITEADKKKIRETMSKEHPTTNEITTAKGIITHIIRA